MTTITAYTEQQSERWLLERTYHAKLRNGRELSVPDFTRAMKQITDCSVPFSTWQEISREEAHATYQRGIPVLLFGETDWEHPQGAPEPWRPNKNMRAIIYGNAYPQSEDTSGTEYAVRYLDASRGNFSNAFWKMWFASDSDTIFDGSDLSYITFLGPCIQFPSTTHYTVIASDGHVYEYTNRAAAIQGFDGLPSKKGEQGTVQTVIFPQFCYYHEVTCPSGVYRLKFFGPRMDEPGYHVKRAEEVVG